MIALWRRQENGPLYRPGGMLSLHLDDWRVDLRVESLYVVVSGFWNASELHVTWWWRWIRPRFEVYTDVSKIDEFRCWSMRLRAALGPIYLSWGLFRKSFDKAFTKALQDAQATKLAMDVLNKKAEECVAGFLAKCRPEAVMDGPRPTPPTDDQLDLEPRE